MINQHFWMSSLTFGKCLPSQLVFGFLRILVQQVPIQGEVNCQLIYVRNRLVLVLLKAPPTALKGLLYTTAFGEKENSYLETEPSDIVRSMGVVGRQNPGNFFFQLLNHAILYSHTEYTFCDIGNFNLIHNNFKRFYSFSSE